MAGRQQLGMGANQDILTNLQATFTRQVASHIDDSTGSDADTHAGICHHIAQHQPCLGIDTDPVGQAQDIGALAETHDRDGRVDPTFGAHAIHTCV